MPHESPGVPLLWLVLSGALRLGHGPGERAAATPQPGEPADPDDGASPVPSPAPIRSMLWRTMPT